MFWFLKRKNKKVCANCGKVNKKGINYAGYEICSEDCMVEFFKKASTEELINLELIDRKMKGIF